MQPIPSASANTFWSYLSPSKIWNMVSWMWRPKESHWKEQNVVACTEFGEWVHLEKHASLSSVLDKTSRPYPMGISGVVAFAKTFFSDISRSGQPDQFFLDGKQVQTPKTVEEILEKLLEVAQGDAEKVALWTQVWNYRLKSTLYDALVQVFNKNYQLNPVCARDGYKKVEIHLNSKEDSLSCVIEGSILNGTDQNVDIHPVNVRYTAEFSFDSKSKIVNVAIQFLEPGPNGG